MYHTVHMFICNPSLTCLFVQQLYNLFPRLFNWIGARKQLMKSAFANRRHMTELIKGLEDTLNPQMCRGLVDTFLVRKMHLEVHNEPNKDCASFVSFALAHLLKQS